MAAPLGYFITFACYGAHLHGDGPYSVDWRHSTIDGPYLPENPAYLAATRAEMTQDPYELDARRRDIVFSAIREVCAYRVWPLLAIHVRTNHVHVVVQASEVPPEKVMNDFKSYSSRALNDAGLDEEGRKRWARHGSTQYINSQADLVDAMRYVSEGQGEPMAVWVDREVLLIR